MKNNQIHIEIPADNIDRAQKFYTGLFGWKITKFDMPESGMDYWGVNIAGECKNNPNISAGMMNRQSPEHRITNYVVVDSVSEYSKKIEELGGKIIVPITEVPTVGKFSVFMDTEKNISAIWENNAESVEQYEKEKNDEKIEENKENSAIHFEIPADDVQRAKKFYEALFGWEITKAEMPECTMDYHLINITGEDCTKVKPSVTGGLMKRQSPEQQGILNYVVVDKEVDTFVADIEKLGGKIIIPTTEVKNIGKFVIFKDSEGGDIAIWKCTEKCAG